MDDGIDELLANHFAHLFIRDPIVIFQESLIQDDETSSDHFEVLSNLSQFLRAELRNVLSTEHPIDELADCTVQAAATSFDDRMESRIQIDGGSVDRFRKRRSFHFHRPAHEGHHEWWTQLLHPHHQGALSLFLSSSETRKFGARLIDFSTTGRREHAPSSSTRRGEHAKVLLPKEPLLARSRSQMRLLHSPIPSSRFRNRR